MKTIIKSIILFSVLMSVFTVSAQNTASGYFLDGYLYRHQMNPAIGNKQNYISLPVVSNINAGLRSSLGLDDLLYNRGGETVTFMHPDVSAEEVMGNLKKNNVINTNFKLDVLSVGFRGFGGYSTIGVNVRTNESLSVPIDMFRLMKEGVSNDTYNIGAMSAHADAYAEVSLNHSRNIGDKLRIGVTLKGLVGVGNLDYEFNKLQLVLGEDEWHAVSEATMHANIAHAEVKTSVNENTGNRYVDEIVTKKFGLGGYGAAVDLGAVVDLGDFQLSAAVLDLGCISWANDHLISTNGEHSVSTSRYQFNIDGGAVNNFDYELDRFGDDLASMYEMQYMGDKGPRTRMLNTTINLGVQYTLPTYKGLSFGLLNTNRVIGNDTYSDFRLSANFAPCRFFSMGANVVTGSYGTGFGWLINLHPTGFNLFAGMDYASFRWTKQGVPMTSTALNVGVNIPF